jgi:hypothetical protein
MTNFRSEQLPTSIFLEWTAVHSIFFGMDNFPLQNVGVHVVKVWSAFSLTLFLHVGTHQTCIQLSQLYITCKEKKKMISVKKSREIKERKEIYGALFSWSTYLFTYTLWKYVVQDLQVPTFHHSHPLPHFHTILVGM